MQAISPWAMRVSQVFCKAGLAPSKRLWVTQYSVEASGTAASWRPASSATTHNSNASRPAPPQSSGSMSAVAPMVCRPSQTAWAWLRPWSITWRAADTGDWPSMNLRTCSRRACWSSEKSKFMANAGHGARKK